MTYSAISRLHTSTIHRCARTRIPSLHYSSPCNVSQNTNYESNSLTGLRTPNITHIIFFPQKNSSQFSSRTNLNCGILTAAIILSLKWQVLTRSLLQLRTFRCCSTENSENELSLSYKPLIWHPEKRSVLYCCWRRALWVYLLHCGKRRSRDLSLLLRHPSVYSCRLATRESRRGAARHGENTASSIVA
jgi:hypothetical protein